MYEKKLYIVSKSGVFKGVYTNKTILFGFLQHIIKEDNHDDISKLFIQVSESLAIPLNYLRLNNAFKPRNLASIYTTETITPETQHYIKIAEVTTNSIWQKLVYNDSIPIDDTNDNDIENPAPKDDIKDL